MDPWGAPQAIKGGKENTRVKTWSKAENLKLSLRLQVSDSAWDPFNLFVDSQEHSEIDSVQSCRSQLFRCSSPASSSSGRRLVVHTCSALPVASRRLPNRNNIGVIHPELADLETPFLPSVSWLLPLPNTHSRTLTHTHAQSWPRCSLTRGQTALPPTKGGFCCWACWPTMSQCGLLTTALLARLAKWKAPHGPIHFQHLPWSRGGVCLSMSGWHLKADVRAQIIVVWLLVVMAFWCWLSTHGWVSNLL